ncbi:MAG: hypothetical protein K2X97_20750 [Mycobacteriaceae bacterium]|nr:hypothetical protein [Mycobacteriaceae bacterium]
MLLAGLRAEELRTPNVEDILTTDHGAAIIQVKGMGVKPRSVPIESELLAVFEAYLVSRIIRCQGSEKLNTATGSVLAR